MISSNLLPLPSQSLDIAQASSAVIEVSRQPEKRCFLSSIRDVFASIVLGTLATVSEFPSCKHGDYRGLRGKIIVDGNLHLQERRAASLLTTRGCIRTNGPGARPLIAV
jgi:hypothetical protein